MKSMLKANLSGKRVLLRVDFNVPLVQGKVFDTSKVLAHVPTIEYLIKNKARVIIISHLGRPDGRKVKEFSLKPIRDVLEKEIKRNVDFSEKVWGKDLEEKTMSLQDGEILLLENLRYEAGEELNEDDFAERLSRLADIFIQDAFASCHRAHASTVGVPKILPSYSGLLLEKEIEGLDKCLKKPRKPLVCVIGGAKISTKINILKTLLKKTDVLIIGGGMANTFLAAEGYEIGESLIEKGLIDEADDILREAHDLGVEVLLPDDVMVSKKISENAETQIKDVSHLSEKDIIVDIGPKSVSKFSAPIKFAGTIFWNGPMGITEIKKFSKDNTAIAKLIASSDACSIVGGGDTIAVLTEKEAAGFDFVSTGGGATLEYIENEGKLPGIVSLES